MMEKTQCDLLFVGNISFDKIRNKSGLSCCVVGGSAYNSAFCAKLVSGLDIKICSAVGNNFPLNVIRERQIDISGISVAEGRSNTFIIDEEYGTVSFENSKPLDFSLRSKEHARHVHISCRKGINRLDRFLGMIEHQSCSSDVMLSSIEEKLSEIVECLGSVNLLFLNHDEYEKLNDYIDNRVECFFPKIVVIVTRGENGIAIRNKVAGINLPGIITEKVVSTTGAGDAFLGAFLGAHHSRRSFASSFATGVSVATLSVQDFGVSHLANKQDEIQRCFDELYPIYQKKQAKLHSLFEGRWP